MRACSGALNSGTPAGTSWTSPSVIITAPPMREGGTSRKAPSRAENSLVSVLSSAACACPVSITRTSNCGKRARRSWMPFSAASVCSVRLPMSWLWLRSTTMATTLFRGSRSSSRKTGLSRASASAATAASRSHAPRWRNHRAASASSASGVTATAISCHDRSGSKDSDQFILLPQPFKQDRHVDLIGLVVAGQHVHDDVDAGAQRIDALHRIVWHCRQQRGTVGPDRPGAGEIVCRDHDRGNAVAAPYGPVFAIGSVERRFDPEGSAVEPAGKFRKDVEGFGQNMVGRHRLQGRYIEAGKYVAQPLGCRAGGIRAEAGGILVARVEKHCAALVHIGVDARNRLPAWHGRGWVDWPVDQRIEGQLVLLDIDAR